MWDIMTTDLIAQQAEGLKKGTEGQYSRINVPEQINRMNGFCLDIDLNKLVIRDFGGEKFEQGLGMSIIKAISAY